MKIFDFIKKITKKNQIKQEEKSIDEKRWREMLHYESSDDTEESIEPKAITQEEIRTEQIESLSSMILNKEDLKKEDIVQYIQKKYENVLLNDADIQSLIAIYHVIEYEDVYGNNNIREFIDDDKKNIVKLVDKIVSNAEEEAKKHKSEEISKFITVDFKLIGEMKNQIEINNEEIEIDK